MKQIDYRRLVNKKVEVKPNYVKGVAGALVMLFLEVGSFGLLRFISWLQSDEDFSFMGDMWNDMSIRHFKTYKEVLDWSIEK